MYRSEVVAIKHSLTSGSSLRRRAYSAYCIHRVQAHSVEDAIVFLNTSCAPFLALSLHSIRDAYVHVSVAAILTFIHQAQPRRGQSYRVLIPAVLESVAGECSPVEQTILITAIACTIQFFAELLF